LVRIEGVVPAMVTPFSKDGEIDEHGLREIVDFLIRKGVDGILVAGTVGEFHSMTRDERRKIFGASVDQCDGRATVYAGTASISTDETIMITKEADDIGVDVITVITPYFVKIDDEEMFQHYKAIAESTDLPIALYSNPGRAGSTISPACLGRCSELSNVVAMKDSSGDISLFQQYLRISGERMAMMIGRDGLILPALILGAKGTVNALGNIVPDLVVQLYENIKRGDYATASKLQEKVSALRLALNVGSFPVAIKEAMNILGLPGGYPRKPLLQLADFRRRALMKSLSELGLSADRER